MKKIVFVAGGCFWGVEHYFKQVKGITKTNCVYLNGTKENPTYQEVCSERFGYVEAVKLCFDDSKISIDKILELLFRVIDPTSKNKQGNDVGIQYRSGFYSESKNDLEIAEKYLNKVSFNYSKKLHFQVEKLVNYFLAEEYHQDYLTKNRYGYCHINLNVLKDFEKK